MTPNQNIKGLSTLADSVGDFIRYWGFRRIHGQIWAMVYLSTSPLSGAELGVALRVSKALISPAIKELESYRLISQVESENSKTKRYKANPDVFQVIQEVLMSREMEILHKINSNFELLDRVVSLTNTDTIDQKRMKDLGEMIKSANLFLSVIVKIESPQTLKAIASLMSGTNY